MTPDFWTALWDKGVPLVLLCIGIYTLWLTWRSDTDKASTERTKMIESSEALANEFKALRESLEKFFLTHFP